MLADKKKSDANDPEILKEVSALLNRNRLPSIKPISEKPCWPIPEVPVPTPQPIKTAIATLDEDLAVKKDLLEENADLLEFQEIILKMEARVISEKEKCLTEKRKAIEELRSKLSEDEINHKNKLSEYKKDIETAKAETERTISSRKSNEVEIESLKKQRKLLKTELSSAQELEQVLKTEEDSLKKLAATNNLEIEAISRTCEELSQKIEDVKKTLHRAEERDKAKFDLRKDRHNYMQELKGNIRVYCRVRPRLANDPPGKDIVNIPNDQTVEIAAPYFAPGAGVSSSKNVKGERFILDKVFQPAATQEEVFGEVSSFVRSVLDGYNVCIFAYGQTGTGKTFTMEGNLSDTKGYGIIPRSIIQIFTGIEDFSRWGWKYTLVVSIQEIYNEKLIDLLCKDNGVSQNTGMHTYQPTEVSVSTPDQLMEIFSLAHENRTTAETKFNASSSRSHCICQIKIIGKNESAGQFIESVLNLIDLAGSESLSGAMKQKDREQETKSINKSLSALKDVITALAERREHIPTRNSKLTYLLKDYLGGNCKTLMFVNISPSAASYVQTIQSLRFACKVNSCFINLVPPKKA